MKKYVRVSRYNPSVPFDLYRVLLRRKQESKDGRVTYKDLAKEWGIGQQYMANAVFRGIKQYDYRIWKEEQNAKQNRDSVSGLHQGRSQKVKVIYVQPGSYRAGAMNEAKRQEEVIRKLQQQLREQRTQEQPR